MSSKSQRKGLTIDWVVLMAAGLGILFAFLAIIKVGMSPPEPVPVVEYNVRVGDTITDNYGQYRMSSRIQSMSFYLQTSTGLCFGNMTAYGEVSLVQVPCDKIPPELLIKEVQSED